MPLGSFASTSGHLTAASHPPTLAASVRLASAADAEALAALLNRAYAVEGAFVDGERTTVAEVAALAGAGQFVVLEGARGLAAAIEVARDGHVATIGMLAVEPALQGIGLGTRLVRIAEALCEAMGCHSIGLRVVNLREELALWCRHLGYAPTGVTPFGRVPAAKRPCHLVEMRKALVGPAGGGPGDGSVAGAAAFA